MGSRHSAFAFRMGMMTQSDECLSSRFQEMTFVEFQHALGAVVFLRSGFTPSRMPVLLNEFFTHNIPLALGRRKDGNEVGHGSPQKARGSPDPGHRSGSLRRSS